MPVYVYKNLTTGAMFEVEQRITEPALTADPGSGDPVKRVVQPVGIAFKGSGFYVTDSRGKNGQAVSRAKDTTKTESAPPSPPTASPTASPSAPAAAAGD